MKSPHVLHVITSLEDGGAQAVLFRLCAQDDAISHHVVSMTDGGKYGPLLEVRGIRVTCLHIPRGRITVGGVYKLWQLIRQLKPSAVQTWMYHANLVGGIAARFAGQRNIVWGIHHTTLEPEQTRYSTILVAKICARLSRSVPRHIICCAEKSKVVHVSMGYCAARMQVVPNGYDLSVFRPNSEAGRRVRKELAIDYDFILIGLVARYDPLKDHVTLLRAVSRLVVQGHELRCLLIGTGVDASNEKLTDHVTSLGLNDHVVFMGRRDDIPAVMSALDLHVLSSSSEGFPNVLAEAMACGTPCVSTDVGDAAEIVGDTGGIVPPGDPDALAISIADLLAERSTPKWELRKQAARQRVYEHFAIDRMIERYHAVWFGAAHT